MKKYTFDTVIFGRVWAFVGSKDEFATLLKKWGFGDNSIKEFMSEDDTAGQAQTNAYNIEGYKTWLIWVKQRRHLLHEVVHTAYHMMKYHGITIDDELLAMLVENIYKGLKS